MLSCALCCNTSSVVVTLLGLVVLMFVCLFRLFVCELRYELELEFRVVLQVTITSHGFGFCWLWNWVYESSQVDAGLKIEMDKIQNTTTIP